MKTIAIFFGLAAAVFAASESINAPPPPTAVFIGTSTTELKDLVVNSSASQSIQFAASSQEIFSVQGIGVIRIANQNNFQLPQYERPEKPDAVIAILTTKDGKRWRAKWDEVPESIKTK